MIYTPRTKIRQTISAQVQKNKFIRDSIDRGNMKIASIAKNIISKYGIETEDIQEELFSAFTHKTVLAAELNSLKTQIEDLNTQVEVLKEFRKYRQFGKHLASLSGQQIDRL